MDNDQNTQAPMSPELFNVLETKLCQAFDRAYCNAEMAAKEGATDAAPWARALAETANALMNLHRNFKPEVKP